MTKAVVDASVAVKWVIPEDHSTAALFLLTQGVDLYAPGHWLAEVSTALWAKSALKGVISRDQASDRVEWLSGLPVREIPVKTVLVAAAALSFDLRLTVYDTLYLAVARYCRAPVVTADRIFHDRVKADSRLSSLMMWVADLPAAVGS